MTWAIVGGSTIAGQYMIDAIRAQSAEAISWLVSGNADHARTFAQAHGIPRATTDIAEALSDPEVTTVYISSTNEKHHPQAMAAIAAGKHVLCEKPLAMRAADAAEMVAAAKAAGVVLATNHHLRCSGSHRAIRQAIAQGRLGRVLSMRVFHAVHLPEHLRGWRINDAGAGGGVIPDITVHDADTVRFLLGEDPVSVTADMAASGMGDGVEDSCMSIWSMPSGAMVFCHESFTHGFAGTGLEVHGTEGSLFAKDVMTQEPVGSVALVTASGREAIPFDATNLYVTGVAAFLSAIRTGGAPAASGEDGLKSLTIAHAVREAARTGQRQTIRTGA